MDVGDPRRKFIHLDGTEIISSSLRGGAYIGYSEDYIMLATRDYMHMYKYIDGHMTRVRDMHKNNSEGFGLVGNNYYLSGSNFTALYDIETGDKVFEMSGKVRCPRWSSKHKIYLLFYQRENSGETLMGMYGARMTLIYESAIRTIPKCVDVYGDYIYLQGFDSVVELYRITQSALKDICARYIRRHNPAQNFDLEQLPEELRQLI